MTSWRGKVDFSEIMAEMLDFDDLVHVEWASEEYDFVSVPNHLRETLSQTASRSRSESSVSSVFLDSELASEEKISQSFSPYMDQSILLVESPATAFNAYQASVNLLDFKWTDREDADENDELITETLLRLWNSLRSCISKALVSVQSTPKQASLENHDLPHLFVGVSWMRGMILLLGIFAMLSQMYLSFPSNVPTNPDRPNALIRANDDMAHMTAVSKPANIVPDVIVHKSWDYIEKPGSVHVPKMLVKDCNLSESDLSRESDLASVPSFESTLHWTIESADFISDTISGMFSLSPKSSQNLSTYLRKFFQWASKFVGRVRDRVKLRIKKLRAQSKTIKAIWRSKMTEWQLLL